jgi:glycosyltransferase involved in cell wall biosynthesis
VNMDKIRLLCCIHDFRGRGAEKVLSTLLNRFDRGKYDLGVFVFHDTFAVDLPNDVEVLSAHIVPDPPSAGFVTKIKGNIRKVIAMGKVIRRYSPDVALSVSGTNITLVIAACLFKRTLKVILSEHTMPSLFSRESRYRLGRFLTDRLISLTYPRADKIVVPSKGVLDDLVEHYRIASNKITVIPNPLDLDLIRRADDAGSGFAFPDDGRFRIGFVGGLSREKNVACLLKAFAKLREEGKPVRLFLVGDGDEKNDLKHLAERLSIAGELSFLGYQKNPYAVLKKFDVLVVPSFFETFSYVMLEAMACGVPVISTKWRGSEDLYTDGGNCLLVPIDAPAEMALAIEKVMTREDLRRDLIRHGRELADNFDAGKIAGKYDRMVEGVAHH